MNRQCNNQKKKNKKTDNAITKGKRTKEQTCLFFCSFSFGYCIVCFFVLFLLVITFSVHLLFFLWLLHCLFFCSFSFGYCIVCSFVLFLLVIALSVFLFFFFWLLLKKNKWTDNVITKRKRTKKQTMQ
jgi:hypothetical protein